MSYLLWHDLAASAGRYPDRPAVAHRGTVLNYRELDERSTRVASFLTARGIGRGDRVGLLMPKSERVVVAILGILKSGAGYVPVDPNAPPQRAAFILHDCAVRGLVTTSQKLARLAQGSVGALETVILASDEPAPAVASGPMAISWKDALATPPRAIDLGDVVETDPAYLLYTSGSTGTPKGVILSHRHALAFVGWCTDTFKLTCADRLSNHAPFHFDLSIADVFGALRVGACVVIVPDEIGPFPRALAQWIQNEGITVWYSVPSALTRLLLHGSLETVRAPKLRTVLYAGEVFPVKYLRAVMAQWPHARFFNLYGPTETNVCTYYALPPQLDAAATDVPIGTACANTHVFALNDQGQVAGTGETGELYVRGPTLLLGYWGKPERTSQALVPHPLNKDYAEMVYRTGDLVRRDAGGNYWFIGRRDHMVKSRGYRIELGEIEQTLYRHPSVGDAVVLAIPDEEIGSRLHAVIVSNERAPTVESLQAFCLEHLPKYMVPEAFHFRVEIPRMSTGKADRTKLSQQLSLHTTRGLDPC